MTRKDALRAARLLVKLYEAGYSDASLAIALQAAVNDAKKGTGRTTNPVP